MRKPKTLSQIQAQVDAWNSKHGIGADVTVRLDDGRLVTTKTASDAYVLGGHSPVLFLVGVKGCYALDRVTPVQTAARAA